jgi:spore germination cell wall hydrolase CwlJ-like protein
MGVVAPWCLGIGLMVSITADAGQDAMVNGSFAPVAVRALDDAGLLVPPSAALQMTDLVQLADAPFGDKPQGLVQQASLALGAPDDFKTMASEREPRADLKHNAHAFPQIDRSHKGDPVVGLRPTFDTKMRRPGGLALIRADDLLFNHDENSPTGGFSAADEAAGPESVENFEPWPDGESPTTAPSSPNMKRADATPGQKGTTGSGTGSTVTMRPASVNERLMQGATPQLPRATALASTTPTPFDAVPVEIVALPGHLNTSIEPQTGRPNYASLIGEDNAVREKRCLAEAIYFEARSEPEEGQAAVAQVVLNRVASGLYPSTICGVVYQNRNRYHACQFSFACEGKSLRINEQDSWQTATRIAEAVTGGKTYLSDVGGATHYHANYVRPRWARQLEKMDVIGHHIFYKLKPGQT